MRVFLFLSLSVLKSDNANGLFGFDGPCLSSGVGAENLTFSCLVQRTRGDVGTVTLPWEIRNQETGDIASDDFVNATGEVVFHEKVREMVRCYLCQFLTIVKVDIFKGWHSGFKRLLNSSFQF